MEITAQGPVLLVPLCNDFLNVNKERVPASIIWSWLSPNPSVSEREKLLCCWRAMAGRSTASVFFCFFLFRVGSIVSQALGYSPNNIQEKQGSGFTSLGERRRECWCFVSILNAELRGKLPLLTTNKCTRWSFKSPFFSCDCFNEQGQRR